MSEIDKHDFLTFLTDALMYEAAPLKMTEPFPDLVFDSTGKLMLAAALESEYGINVSLDDLIQCNTPGDVYAIVCRML